MTFYLYATSLPIKSWWLNSFKLEKYNDIISIFKSSFIAWHCYPVITVNVRQSPQPMALKETMGTPISPLAKQLLIALLTSRTQLDSMCKNLNNIFNKIQLTKAHNSTVQKSITTQMVLFLTKVYTHYTLNLSQTDTIHIHRSMMDPLLQWIIKDQQQTIKQIPPTHLQHSQKFTSDNTLAHHKHSHPWFHHTPLPLPTKQTKPQW